MKRLSEETLNAYADGALEADARAEVEAQLQTDAEARALLDRLRTADRLAIEAFAAPMHEPPPQALVDAILGAPAPGAADRDASLGGRPSPAWSAREAGLAAGCKPGPRCRPRRRRFPRASAGSAACRAGWRAGAGGGARRERPPSPAGAPSEREHAGDRGARGAARRVGVVATFMDRHARPCREVEVLPAGTDPPHRVAAAVACRDAAGGWVVEGSHPAGRPPAGYRLTVRALRCA